MRRPRHREKSSLLWKMLGVAVAINLLLWPVLIHQGVFAGIRQEVLIPVRLISLPPSHKPPDALQKVARVPAPPVSAPHAAPIPPRRRPNPPPPRVAAAPKPAAPTPKPAAPPRPLATVALMPVKKPVLATPKPRPKPVPPSLRPAQVAQVPRAVPTPRPAAVAHTDAAQAARAALQTRVARARQLEAEGHRIAELIAQQRAARVAALPPVAPAAPAVTETTAVTPNVGEAGREAPKIAVTPPPHIEPPTAPKIASARLVPATVVRKEYPVVPDAMMKSSWRAAFQGRFLVRQDGTATVQMVSSTGFPALDRRALEAARRWKFRPARLNGKPVTTSQAFAFRYDVHPTH